MAEVTKDFDVERTAGTRESSTFTVGGEKFTVREWVSADVLAEFGRREVSHYGDTLDAYDKFVKECIVEADGEKWDKVRKEADPPLTLGQVETILWWLVGQVTDRPTEASSSSRRGRAAPAAT